MRSGAYALSLLATPLNAQVVTALNGEAKSLVDLRRAAGSPPQTTMRGHLRKLSELGILERHRQNDFPGSVELRLDRAGRDLLGVASLLQLWLRAAPDGPIELGTPAAKSTVKALSDGWSSAIVRALAARPLSLTELNRLISGINYPSLERRLLAMRLAYLIEARAGSGRSKPYGVTCWLRRGMAPLAAAARWEREHLPNETPPPAPIDAEAIFLLAIPLIRLSPDLSGRARLAVEMRHAGPERLAGVFVEVREGRVISCVSKLRGEATGWASGPSSAWFTAVLDAEPDHLDVGGDSDLVHGLLSAMHGVLRSYTAQP